MYPPKDDAAPAAAPPQKTQILIEFDHGTTAIGYKIAGSGSLIIHLGMLETVKGMLIAEKTQTAEKKQSSIVSLPLGTRLL